MCHQHNRSLCRILCIFLCAPGDLHQNAALCGKLRIISHFSVVFQKPLGYMFCVSGRTVNGKKFLRLLNDIFGIVFHCEVSFVKISVL